jgi:hypothetical protein
MKIIKLYNFAPRFRIQVSRFKTRLRWDNELPLKDKTCYALRFLI